jgi:hypothetical protein
MADAPTDADIKVLLVDAAIKYISENAGPFANEVLAYVSGSVDAQIASLTAHKLKVTPM